MKAVAHAMNPQSIRVLLSGKIPTPPENFNQIIRFAHLLVHNSTIVVKDGESGGPRAAGGTFAKPPPID